MMKRVVHILKKGSFCTGGLLLLANMLGTISYTHVDESNVHINDNRSRTISEKEFWAKAYRKTGESDFNYLGRLTDLINDRIYHINPKFVIPTFFENYILWAYAKHLGYYEWFDTKRAVRVGGGLCSQHAIIFNNILREQGFVSRILGLNGHVVNEVLVNGTWYVYDPDFNVIFLKSLAMLESEPSLVYDGYQRAGLSDDASRHWQGVYASSTDNWHFKTSADYSMRNYIIETLSFYFVWVIPLFFIGVGLLIKKQVLPAQDKN